ncbi:hypothetical protein XENOCAPTIV_021956, partial [Xenoophorus captivus]
KEEALKLSIPRASSLNENVNHSALLKLGDTVSERVNRFDSKTGAESGSSSFGLSKLQETRRIFEQRTLQPPEEVGSVQRSTAGQAISQEKDGFGLSGDSYLNSSLSSITVTVTSASFEAKSEPGAQEEETEQMGTTMVESQAKEKDFSTEASGGTLVQAEVHACLEKGEKEPPPSSPTSGEKGEDSEWREKEEYENDEDGSRREDYSEGDLVDISAYSGIGEEDSGGSQLDDEDDEEDEEPYQPESSCSEMPGLPEEEEAPPPSRKIRFSTEPIKVSSLCFSSLYILPH